MAKKPTVTTVSSGFASNTQLNSNFTALRDAFDNTLSLDGSTPNAMQADLDLNGNALLNVGNIDADNLTLNGQTVTELSSVPAWRGAWVTARSYAKNDLVKQAGSAYICLVAHISGTFSTDLTMLRWELFAEKGAAGAGTGDMLAANNLSDVANVATSRSNLGLGTVATENTVPVAKGGTGATDAATARTNLGLAIGTDVQAYDAALASLAGLSLVQGDLLYATAADTLVRLPKGTAGQVLRMNAGATAPEWATTAGLQVGTAQATTSGTNADFTGLPAAIRRITLVYSNVSLTGSGDLLLQLGTSGGFVTTGYTSISWNSASSTSTSGMLIRLSGAANATSGVVHLVRVSGNDWVSSHTGGHGTTPVMGSGSITLGAELTQIRLTNTATGANSFDAGSVNIMWE